MEFEGNIVHIGEIETFDSGFSKLGFAIKTEGQYPQTYYFELHKDKIALMNNRAVGQKLKVMFNIQGREWTNPQGETKYFTTLQAWKVEGETISAAQHQAQDNPPPPPPIGDEDDLPF